MPIRQKVHKLKIRGRIWRIIFDSKSVPRKCHGLCDYDTNTIYIRPDGEMRATLLHEIAHAMFPDLLESVILEFDRVAEEALKILELHEKTKSE